MKLSEYVDELAKAGDDQEKKDLVTGAMLGFMSAEVAASILVKKQEFDLKGKTNPWLTKTVGSIIAVTVGMFALVGIAFAVKLLMQILGVI